MGWAASLNPRQDSGAYGWDRLGMEDCGRVHVQCRSEGKCPRTRVSVGLCAHAACEWPVCTRASVCCCGEEGTAWGQGSAVAEGALSLSLSPALFHSGSEVTHSSGDRMSPQVTRLALRSTSPIDAALSGSGHTQAGQKDPKYHPVAGQRHLARQEGGSCRSGGEGCGGSGPRESESVLMGGGQTFGGGARGSVYSLHPHPGLAQWQGHATSV